MFRGHTIAGVPPVGVVLARLFRLLLLLLYYEFRRAHNTNGLVHHGIHGLRCIVRLFRLVPASFSVMDVSLPSE